jgi:hypothetical protein
MRRLLEMNFHLYYSRYAIQDEKLCMLMDSSIETANPSKLYYGLKELAIKADKHDDLLIQDFTSLLPTGTDHLEDIPDEEKRLSIHIFKSGLQKHWTPSKRQTQINFLVALHISYWPWLSALII